MSKASKCVSLVIQSAVLWRIFGFLLLNRADTLLSIRNYKAVTTSFKKIEAYVVSDGKRTKNLILHCLQSFTQFPLQNEYKRLPN